MSAPSVSGTPAPGVVCLLMDPATAATLSTLIECAGFGENHAEWLWAAAEIRSTAARALDLAGDLPRVTLAGAPKLRLIEVGDL